MENIRGVSGDIVDMKTYNLYESASVKVRSLPVTPGFASLNNLPLPFLFLYADPNLQNRHRGAVLLMSFSSRLFHRLFAFASYV
jgi:hypothetical protein